MMVPLEARRRCNARLDTRNLIRKQNHEVQQTIDRDHARRPSVADVRGAPAARLTRAGMNISGSIRPVRITANAGYHRIENEDHVQGNTEHRFEGRLFVTVGISRRGRIP
jgi:hypothetical protein